MRGRLNGGGSYIRTPACSSASKKIYVGVGQRCRRWFPDHGKGTLLLAKVAWAIGEAEPHARRSCIGGKPIKL